MTAVRDAPERRHINTQAGIYLTNPETNSRTNPEANPRINPEANPRTNPETSLRTNPEVNPRTNPETSIRTNPEANLRTNPEANEVIYPYLSELQDMLIGNLLHSWKLNWETKEICPSLASPHISRKIFQEFGSTTGRSKLPNLPQTKNTAMYTFTRTYLQP